MKEIYDIAFTTGGSDPRLVTYILIPSVSAKDEAIKKATELVGPKEFKLESIREVTPEKKDWDVFVFSRENTEEAINVYLAEKSLEEAVLKCKKMTGIDDLALTQVNILKREDDGASFNLTREINDQASTSQYLTVFVNAKNLASAVLKAENTTGLKGFQVKSVFANPKKL